MAEALVSVLHWTVVVGMGAGGVFAVVRALL